MEFEATFEKAKALIASTPGFHGLTLSRCLERPGQYLLLVTWDRLEDHLEGSRGSDRYPDWSRLLHRFYEPFPDVLHFEVVDTAEISGVYGRSATRSGRQVGTGVPSAAHQPA
jgi:heme-degrading monooxygenase HmoA